MLLRTSLLVVCKKKPKPCFRFFLIHRVPTYEPSSCKLSKMQTCLCTSSHMLLHTPGAHYHRHASSAVAALSCTPLYSQWERIHLPRRQLPETWAQSPVRKIPWKRRWQPAPEFWPGEFHGQRNPAGYSSQGCKELDATE